MFHSFQGVVMFSILHRGVMFSKLCSLYPNQVMGRGRRTHSVSALLLVSTYAGSSLTTDSDASADTVSASSRSCCCASIIE